MNYYNPYMSNYPYQENNQQYINDLSEAIHYCTITEGHCSKAVPFYYSMRGKSMNPVTPSIIAALITGAVSLIGTIVTVLVSNSSTQAKIHAELEKHNAIQDERIKTLTESVNKHNGFAERIPRLEARIDNLQEEVRRLEDDKR